MDFSIIKFCSSLFVIISSLGSISLAQTTFTIDDHSSLATYLSGDVKAEKLYFHRYPNYEVLKNAIEQNPNKEHVKSLEIRNISSTDVFYLNLQGYRKLNMLEISGFRADSFDLRTLHPIQSLRALVIETDIRNYKQLFEYLTRYDSFTYLSISSKYIDSLIFPNPPLHNLVFYYVSGNYKNIPVCDTSHKMLRNVYFASKQEIAFIPNYVIESYRNMTFGAILQLDLPRSTLLYLEKLYGAPIEFEFPADKRVYCECYEYTYKEGAFNLFRIQKTAKMKINRNTKKVFYP